MENQQHADIAVTSNCGQNLDRLPEVLANFRACQARVEQALASNNRPANSVRTLLASKTQASALVTALAAELSQGDLEQPILLGENRVQEVMAKAPALAPLIAANRAELHLIGPLQRNKINAVLNNGVSTIESVADFETGLAIHERSSRPIRIMVQVNVSGEASKSGCIPDNALELASRLVQLPNLELTGFMCLGLPPVLEDSEITNATDILDGYWVLRQIRDDAIAGGLVSDAELSMGMSLDLELAIAAGATIVRVGTAIFGNRPPIR